MNGRLYDPALGRFLSPDPYVQSPDFSQNFNRYSYCLNNPLRYSDPSGKITWNDIIGGISLVAGVILMPIVPWLGTALIVAGFSHFAYTIDNMQNSNMNWNQASNSAGFQFSTTIGFNHASTKEKRHSYADIDYNIGNNSSYAYGGVDASNSNDDINLSANNLVRKTYENGSLTIQYGVFKNESDDIGVQIDVIYMGDELMLNSHWEQKVTNNMPKTDGSEITGDIYGSFSYYDTGRSHDNRKYYPDNEMKNHIAGSSVYFQDAPRRPGFETRDVFWHGELKLFNNNGQPILRINYGFTIDYSGCHPIPYTYYIYPY